MSEFWGIIFQIPKIDIINHSIKLKCPPKININAIKIADKCDGFWAYRLIRG